MLSPSTFPHLVYKPSTEFNSTHNGLHGQNGTSKTCSVQIDEDDEKGRLNDFFVDNNSQVYSYLHYVNPLNVVCQKKRSSTSSLKLIKMFLFSIKVRITEK